MVDAAEGLTIAEVADLLGVTGKSIESRIAAGDLATIQSGGRRRISPEEFERFRGEYVREMAASFADDLPGFEGMPELVENLHARKEFVERMAALAPDAEVSAEEVAALLGLSGLQVHELVADRTFESRTVDGDLRIRMGPVRAFMDAETERQLAGMAKFTALETRLGLTE